MLASMLPNEKLAQLIYVVFVSLEVKHSSPNNVLGNF